jgi:hypothetical protein
LKIPFEEVGEVDGTSGLSLAVCLARHGEKRKDENLETLTSLNVPDTTPAIILDQDDDLLILYTGFGEICHGPHGNIPREI